MPWCGASELCGGATRRSGAAELCGGAARRGCAAVRGVGAARRSGAAIAWPTRPQTVSLLYQSSAVRPTPFVAGRLERHDLDDAGWCAFLCFPEARPLTYRWFMGIHDYPRYAITALMAISTVGNCVFAITHGRKWCDRRPDVPWVMAFLALPTVGNGVVGGRMYRG